MSYPTEMQASLAKVEASRQRRLHETFPKLSPDEREHILHAFHPDYIRDAFREIRMGSNKGDSTPRELADVLEAAPILDVDEVTPLLSRLEPDAVCDVLILGGGGAGASAALLAQEHGAAS